MDFLNLVYNNRWLGLAGVSCILIIEHLQAMSYIREAPHQDAEGWNSSASDAFDELADLAFQVSDSGFTFLFFFFSVAIGLIFLIYLALNPYIHSWNKDNDLRKSGLIVLIDYVLLGVFYVPILGQFTGIQYCTVQGLAEVNDDLECWTKEQLGYFQTGLIMLNVTVLLAAGVFPALKNERLGTERKWGNECYFEGVFKLQTALVVFFFCPIKIPEIGLVVSVLLIGYLALVNCYSEIHIASLKMGLLFGQFWMFVCSCVSKNDAEKASHMLIGWAPFIAVGYSVLYIKKLFVKRELKQLPILK